MRGSRVIKQDKGIKTIATCPGSKVKINILCFADDLSFLFREKKSFANLLQKIQLFGSFSSLEMSPEKCEIITFGKECPIEICGVKRAKGDKIRILGVYYDKNGVANNLPEIISEICRVLTTLKGLHLNLFSRVDCLKAHALRETLLHCKLHFTHSKTT